MNELTLIILSFSILLYFESQIVLLSTVLLVAAFIFLNYKKIKYTSIDVERDIEVENNSTSSSNESSLKTIDIKNKIPKIIKARNIEKLKNKSDIVYSKNNESLLNSNFVIFYSSLTGSSKKAAEKILSTLTDLNIKNKPKLLNLDNDLEDFDSYFITTPPDLKDLVYILVLPSYESDSPIDYFLEFLQDTYQDFRIDKFPLKKLTGFTVLGLGDKESYSENFCYQAKFADKFLSKLGGRRLYPLGEVCVKNNPKLVDSWCDGLGKMLVDNEPFILQKNESDSESDSDSDNENDNDNSDEGTLVDMEDLSNDSNGKDNKKIKLIKKEMVAKDSPTYKSLTKQGYTIVGSHSGVKICRWTKSALRGRGFCYKFAFYGINSHRCMETTPSLSCSNKCVFCWRHGTNPVGTTWRWEVDKPDLILNGALAGHYKKIKQMRGVPGILFDRFDEAFTVKHCALSLVGEPIFYPYINEFLKMLHDKGISSFLVCNAQHPDQLETLNKVTQLYVSIDAPTKSSLKTVDRPLFRDFWERMNRCLDILNTTQKHQRTVFRLTLVKGFNMEDVLSYADLVEKANPSLIEIKGATFCGSSDGNGNPLTMQNIPFYEECQRFVNKLNNELNNRGLAYGLAAEHAHSCCILMAHRKFFINNKWFTHIDYDKFFELLKSGKSFDSMDYISETPDWAYYGSKEAGFNPYDVRYNRKEEKLKKKLQREQEHEQEQEQEQQPE